MTYNKKYSIYEMIDMNRGGIYQDFTDGEEVRKAWWGFQPYNPPDGPSFVNEEFINFVESRDNYLIRRPIFNITTLTEEFYNAINNLTEYINRSKNKNKFINNLLNLQEYLMENENNISSINFDTIANNISKELNISILDKLGCGDHGCAYNIGDKVLKITTDKSEVIENSKLLNKDLKYLATPFKIFKIVLNNGVAYAIISEKFKTDENKFEKKIDRLSYVFKHILNIGDFEDLIDNLVLGDIEKYNRNKEKIEKYFNKNLVDREFFNNLVEIGKELRKYDINTGEFYSPRNLGYTKEGNVGFFDIGDSFIKKNIPSNLKSINVKEDGSNKFSTDDSIGRTDFPTYNQKSTEPSIENNLDANSAMYNEDLEYKHVKGAASDDEYRLGESNISMSKEDYQRIDNEDVSDFIKQINIYLSQIKSNVYLSEDDLNDLKFLLLSMNYNRDMYKERMGNDKFNHVFNFLYSFLKKKNVLNEERIKAWIPGSKAVTVKKRCRLAGKGNTSDACNQGDINNLEFTALKEDIDLKEAYNDKSALKTVIDGKRDVAFLSIDNDKMSLIKDADLRMIGPIFQKDYGYSQNKHIIYRDINKAKELQKILQKNEGYLPINTPEETRRIGELLGYRKESIDKFIDKHFSKESINENVMEEGNGIMELQELPFKNEIYKMGGKIYSVGGAVRDEFLGKKSKDLDILITGIPMDKLSQIMSNYGKVDAVGKSFGILKFKPEGANEEIDVAIPRSEIPTGKGGHKGFDVKSDHKLSLKDDMIRRDFTINAIAKDIQGNIFDPFGGQQDLQNKIIRIVNPKAFVDDPLRMLRAVQFASRFNFDIEPKTLQMIKENAHRIKEISPERILTEFEKIVKKGDVLTGVEELIKTNLFKNIFGFDFKHINRSDFNNVKTLGEFIYLLTRSLQDPEKFYKDKLKGDIDTYKEIKGLIIGMADNTDNPLKNRLTAFNINTVSSKAFSSSILPPPVQRAVDEFKMGKYPKTIKELNVDGNDLKRYGFEGAEIGNKLKSLLINVYADNVKNNKEDLLKILGYQPTEKY